MSDTEKIEKDKKEVIEILKPIKVDALNSSATGKATKFNIPSIQINNEEYHGFGGRRSSIPASFSNFNIQAYRGRRHSEVILSPTDEFRRDYFKFSNSPINKINDCVNDVFGSLSRKFRSKNQSIEVYASSNPMDTTGDLETKNGEASEAEFVKRYKNPLEDSYEGNEKILYNGNEFLEEDEESEFKKGVSVSTDGPLQDSVYLTNESRSSSRRNSDESGRKRNLKNSEEIVLAPLELESPAPGSRRDSGQDLVRRKTSSPLSLKNPRRRSMECTRPATRGEILHRFPSHMSEGKKTPSDRYQDNLRTIVLSYFHLTHPKWEHANVNGTRHWDRRSSRVLVHPMTNSIPRDAFGSRMSVINDEVVADSLPYNETDKDSLLKCSELEYSSGGLLCPDNEDDPDSITVRPPDSETLLFSDGKRRIDLVLVYEEEDEGVMTELANIKKERRKTFRENLEKEGLEFELEDKKLTIKCGKGGQRVSPMCLIRGIFQHAGKTAVERTVDQRPKWNEKKCMGSFDEKTYFLKIHAPWQVMTRYAELINIKMPIREKDEERKQPEEEQPLYSFFNKLFDYDHKRIPDEPSFYKATFTRDKEDQFVVKDRETFFTAAQRSQIVWQILMRAKYDTTEKVGIRRLLNDETFLAAFPLHEGRYDVDASEGFLFDRRLLYLEWARPGKWYKKQPLWLVRKYFGDKIGLYFAWLGFYTYMLALPAIVGVFCFLYGLGSIEKSDNIPAKEICNEKGAGNLTLCPMCDKACRYLKLGDSCMYAKITYLFDNPATVFFAIFMSFWATMYLELWKRQQSIIVWEWDLQLVEEDEEPRPEFETSVKTFRINPVTREKEPYLPAWSKALRFLATGATVLCMIFVVLGAVLGTIIYRISLVAVIYSSAGEYLRDHAKIFTSMTAALINLVIIMILTKFYHQLAIWLTNIENPRTQREYEDSYTFKIFLFEFVNFYSSLIYIAFFKGRFFMYPGDTDARSSEFLKLKGDVCDPAGCLSELCIQLAIIMIGKQCLNNFLELLYPKFWNWWYHRIHYNNTKKDFKRKLTRWEEDYQMQDAGRLALFEEYLEMVLQYGFVTLFVAAFPLAPLFAFLNNIGEIRLDAYKMVTQSRRPLAERVQNIGAWYGILKGLTYAAVVSNAFVIGYTSDFIPRMVYKFVYSPTHDLQGYIRSSLSEFNTSDYTEDMGSPDDDPDPPICYYRGYRNPPDHPTDPYDLSPQYWHVFAARLAFVVVFEHFVFALTGIMAYIIPDVPAAVKTQMQRERLLAKEARYERGLKSAGNDEEFLSAVRDQNQSRLESILRRDSWARRFSKYSDDFDSHINVQSKGRKISDPTPEVS